MLKDRLAATISEGIESRHRKVLVGEASTAHLTVELKQNPRRHDVTVQRVSREVTSHGTVQCGALRVTIMRGTGSRALGLDPPLVLLPYLMRLPHLSKMEIVALPAQAKSPPVPEEG